jgi:hypothetical protein
MTPSQSSASQPAELVLACTLVKKFLKDNKLKATSKTFEIELNRKEWSTGQNGALEQAGITSLQDLIIRSLKGASSERGVSVSATSESSSSDSESDSEDDSADEDRVRCQWLGCSKWYSTPQELFVS